MRRIALVLSLAALTTGLVVATGGVSFGEQASSSLLQTQAGFIEGGKAHNCAIVGDRSIRCWGDGTQGQLGNGAKRSVGGDDSSSAARSGPVTFGPGAGTQLKGLAIAAGNDFSCVLSQLRFVRCFGDNSTGQLGIGSRVSTTKPADRVDLGREASEITAGGRHTCAIIQETGVVRCWGNNGAGQLGDGTTNAALKPTAPVNLGAPAVAISAGSNFTCAIRKDNGQVRCWGGNAFGQLGNGTTNASSTPVTVQLSEAAVALATGDDHACALLRETRQVSCWGRNATGQLGNGSTVNSPTPQAVKLDVNATVVTAGGNHTCVKIEGDATARCWGQNSDGELGYGDTRNRSTPGPDVKLSNKVNVLAAGEKHTCAALVTGRVQCWGEGADGRLGNGSEFPVGSEESPSEASDNFARLGGLVDQAGTDVEVDIQARTDVVTNAARQQEIKGALLVTLGARNDPPGTTKVVLEVPKETKFVPLSATPGSTFDPNTNSWEIDLNDDDDNNSDDDDEAESDSDRRAALTAALLGTLERRDKTSTAPINARVIARVASTEVDDTDATMADNGTPDADQQDDQDSTTVFLPPPPPPFPSDDTPPPVPPREGADLELWVEDSPVTIMPPPPDISQLPPPPPPLPPGQLQLRVPPPGLLPPGVLPPPPVIFSAPPPAPPPPPPTTANVSPLVPSVASVQSQVVISNSGPLPSGPVSVKVTDDPASQQSAPTVVLPSYGTYNSATDSWTIPNLDAGQTATLTVNSRPSEPGPVTVAAQVMSSATPDPDSRPGNNVSKEDDSKKAEVAEVPLITVNLNAVASDIDRLTGKTVAGKVVSSTPVKIATKLFGGFFQSNFGVRITKAADPKRFVELARASDVTYTRNHKISMRIPAKMRKQLKKVKTLWIQTTSTDAQGHTRTVSQQVKLKRSK